MISNILLFVSVVIIIYFFKDIITLLSILCILLCLYVCFSGNTDINLI